MAIDAARLRAFLNAGEQTAPTDELDSCILSARGLLDRYIADVDADDGIPADLDDRAHLLVAAELFNIGNAPNGFLNQQFDDGTTAAVRVSTDALRPARRLLESWVPPVTFA